MCLFAALLCLPLPTILVPMHVNLLPSLELPLRGRLAWRADVTFGEDASFDGLGDALCVEADNGECMVCHTRPFADTLKRMLAERYSEDCEAYTEAKSERIPTQQTPI
jgi:hypothetical protein